MNDWVVIRVTIYSSNFLGLIDKKQHEVLHVILLYDINVMKALYRIQKYVQPFLNLQTVVALFEEAI